MMKKKDSNSPTTMPPKIAAEKLADVEVRKAKLDHE